MLFQGNEGVDTFSPGSTGLYKGEPFCLPRYSYQQVFPVIFERLAATYTNQFNDCRRQAESTQRMTTASAGCSIFERLCRNRTDLHNVAVPADLRFDLFLLWKSSNASWDSRDLPQSPPPHEAWARCSMQSNRRVENRTAREKPSGWFIQASCQWATIAFARQLQWRT